MSSNRKENPDKAELNKKEIKPVIPAENLDRDDKTSEENVSDKKNRADLNNKNSKSPQTKDSSQR